MVVDDYDAALELTIIDGPFIILRIISENILLIGVLCPLVDLISLGGSLHPFG